jgi:hypothetical protein
LAVFPRPPTETPQPKINSLTQRSTHNRAKDVG